MYLAVLYAEESNGFFSDYLSVTINEDINDHKCKPMITNLYCMAKLVCDKKENSDWFS